MGLILDTNFLVNLEREIAHAVPGKAHNFLEQNPAQTFVITFTIAGELACGTSLSTKAKWEIFCQPLLVLDYTSEIGWQYGSLFRYLKPQGLLIGANDLWIAATALVHGFPLVTNDVTEFKRVPGLQVLSY